jgi:hypothetical protein
MKWIKLFENYVMTNHDITLKDELESFVDNLAYLLDNGFVFKLRRKNLRLIVITH